MAGRSATLSSRRAILRAAVAATLGTVAGVLGRPIMAAGSDGDTLRVGGDHAGAMPTRIAGTRSGPVLVAEAAGAGVGVTGATDSGIGIYGMAETGHGVVGSSRTGSAIQGWSQEGYALRARYGRIKADSVSGVVFLGPGIDRAIVTPLAPIVPGAFVLLAPMADLGGRSLWAERQFEEGTITIRLSSPVEMETRIGWLMIG